MQIVVNSVSIALLLVSAKVTQVQADRDEPCISGACSWSGGDNIRSLYSTLSINGSQELIGDVTPAAGWNIEGCNPNWDSGTHSVQMVCSGESNQTQHCNHLFNGGAEDTIVRLPDNCGKGPFARVVTMNESNGIYMIDMDYHLSQIQPSRGSVDFSLVLGGGPKSVAGSSFERRASISSSLIPFSLQKLNTLFNQSLSCSVGDDSATLGIEADGSVDINGTLVFSGSVSGSIIPPGIGDFSLTTTVSASGSVDFKLDASAEATIGTGDIPLLNVGLPGLDIPGVAQIGPAIEVDGSVDIGVGLQTMASLNTEWTLNTVLVLPSSAGQSSTNASSCSPDPIHISINPAATSINASVTGHVIPKLTLGISVLDNLASAIAFLESDLSTTAQVSLNGLSRRDHPRNFMKRQNSQVCVGVNAAINVVAGVEGSIGPLTDEDSIPIFDQMFPLFQQCSNIGGTSQRRELDVLKRQDNNLQCPSASELASSLVSLI